MLHLTTTKSLMWHNNGIVPCANVTYLHIPHLNILVPVAVWWRLAKRCSALQTRLMIKD